MDVWTSKCYLNGEFGASSCQRYDKMLRGWSTVSLPRDAVPMSPTIRHLVMKLCFMYDPNTQNGRRSTKKGKPCSNATSQPCSPFVRQQIRLHQVSCCVFSHDPL